MKYIKTYEGLFDFFKKKKSGDIFTDKECEILVKSLNISRIVNVYFVNSYGRDEGDIKSVEIMILKNGRSSIIPNYIRLYKQDGLYKVIGFREVENAAEDENYRCKKYNNIEDVISECRYRILCCFLSFFIESKKFQGFGIDNLMYNNMINSEVDIDKYTEAESLINDYSVISNSKLNLDRLNMLIGDYYFSEKPSGCSDIDWPKFKKDISSSKEKLVSIIKHLFGI